MTTIEQVRPDVMDQLLDQKNLDPETDIIDQFLNPETDIKHQFLDPETDIFVNFFSESRN